MSADAINETAPSKDGQQGSTVAPLAAAREWLRRDGKVALATVIETWGSSPVPVGGQLAISADGAFEGSVSGGCIEGAVITEAADVLAAGKPAVLSYGVSDETAWSVGLPCGGKVRVYVERLAGAEGDALLARATEAQWRRSGLVLEKRLADGVHRVYSHDEANLPADIADRFRTAKSGVAETPDGPVFRHALVPPARIIAIGATHIAQVLAGLAKTVGYEMVVVDPRSAFATPDRFPGTTVMAEWPETALPALGLDPYTALAVLAHVENIDDEALRLAVKAPLRYVGALGSKRNHTRRVERLTAAGITPDEIARIKSPIGLDIGAVTPAEIALAVMSEIVAAVRRN